MAQHVKEFNIECFRGIRNLRLQNLYDINILTGDNNAEKTSVLGVINFLSGITDLRNLIYSTRRAINRMKKAILLMNSVINAKNGILLLDEFETALHTTAMNRVFEWILKICMKSI